MGCILESPPAEGISKASNKHWREAMENINAAQTATDEELLQAADATSVDYRDDAVAPSVVLGEPCDV
jgi:hypothetical protein